LEKKVSTMEDFDRRYPAFGGFLPWFCARGALEDGRCRGLNDPAGGLEPTYDFHDSMPGLDNGQMAWAIVALVHVLKKKATADSTGRISSLAERWEQRLLRMQATAVNLFYNGNGSGTVRALTWLRNRSVDATDPTNSWTYSSYVLDDAFEGEMMVLFMDLLGNWSGYPNDGKDEKALIWEHKKTKVEAAAFHMPSGENLTVQKGFWFSSHEQWKTLQMPYLAVPHVGKLFANGELARLTHSLAEQIPGLFASVSAPPGVVCGTDAGYCSATGIEELAYQAVDQDLVVTPYAAFPSILVDRGAGLAWYNYMLSLPGMQSLHGSLESSAVNHAGVRTMLTWDAKATTVLAMLGGTGDLLGRAMDEANVTSLFVERVGGMYAAVFNETLSDISELPLPPMTIPATFESAWQDWSNASCGCADSVSPLLTAGNGRRLRGV